jgi:hypothetical protein
VKTTPRVGARPSTRSGPKMACSTTPKRASTVAGTRSIASRAPSRLLTLTFNISRLPNPRSWAMPVGSDGYRAVLVRRQLTPGLISLLPGRAGLPPFISFSISYPELDSAVRRAMRRISKVAQPACNRCVQATPDCALLFIVAQVAGAPDADR